jgi:pimeloyl-ACP methyl ester carboxylesterase
MVDESLNFGWNDLTLAGTLRLPDGAGPHPVVVMMQGSGPSDRTSNGYFPQIQEAFLARGIGTYAFDKPGCGESTGDWRDYALEARADQVVAALGVVRANHAVRASRTGIWGQSQGGWLAQMLASRLDDLPFAIADSGPSISIPDQNLYGCEHEMRAEGHTEADIERALAFLDDVHKAAGDGLPYDAVESKLLESARTQSWYGYAPVEDSKDWELDCQFIQEAYEPVEALSQIHVPFLAIYGGRDLLVPAWQSAEESGHALQQAGNADATVVVFPNGNHRLQDTSTGEFVTGFLELLADWLAVRVS